MEVNERHPSIKENRIISEAAGPTEQWGIATSDAHSYFNDESYKVFRTIAQNYYDEVEIGRLVKEHFLTAIENALET